MRLGCGAGWELSVAVVVVVVVRADGTGVVLRLLPETLAAVGTRLAGSACSCGTGVLESGCSRRFSSTGAAAADLAVVPLPFAWDRAETDLVRLPLVSFSEMPDLREAWLPDFWVMASELGERREVVSVCALLAKVLEDGESRYS